jgi:hypothetical protein
MRTVQLAGDGLPIPSHRPVFGLQPVENLCRRLDPSGVRSGNALRNGGIEFRKPRFQIVR